MIHSTWVYPKTPSSQPAGWTIKHVFIWPISELSVESDIKHVTKQLIFNVEWKEVEDLKVRFGCRGAVKLRYCDFLFEMNVVEQLDSGLCAADVPFKNSINKVEKRSASKWKKDRKKHHYEAVFQHKKLLKKDRRSNKHITLLAQFIINQEA